MNHRWQQWGLLERETGVLISKSEVCSINYELISSLRDYARSVPKRRARILLHRKETDPLHQMLIAAEAFTIWPPLLNNRGPQAWTAIEGDLAFVRYRPPGEIEDLKLLSAHNPDANTMLQFSGVGWYTFVPLTEMPVYLETKLGPHSATTFADWGPQSIDDPRARDLLEKIRQMGFIKPNTVEAESAKSNGQ